MQSNAKTVDQYLAELPADRRDALNQVRRVILKNLPTGYEEGMQYGMIGYFVPHSVYPPGYHCDPKQPLPFAGLASQKNHMAMYLMCIYNDAEQQARFQKEWKATGKKLDMGKACIRFKKIDDVPLGVVGRAIKRVPAKKYVEHYESALKTGGKRKIATSAKAKKKTAAKVSRSGAGAVNKKSVASAKKKTRSARGTGARKSQATSKSSR